ncbi:MAG: RNA methyltransferase [Planctomycetota bacterium]|nr:RNA methyltransferase [Planctomycetota bacterium]
MPDPGEAPRRLRRAETVLAQRTGRLMVVLERCADENNRQAVLRTAEAFGVHHVALVDTPGLTATRISKSVTRGAAAWLELHRFTTSAECLAALRAGGWTIWATDLSPAAEEASAAQLAPLPAKLALVFGREVDGVSAEMLAAAERRLYLPIAGFTESFNLSVSAALLLQRLFDACPEMRGDLDEDTRAAIRARWYRRLAGGKHPARFDEWLASPPEPLDELRAGPTDKLPRMRKRLARRLGMRTSATEGGGAPSEPAG